MSSPNSKEGSNIPDKGAEGDLTPSTMSEHTELRVKLSEQAKVTEDGRAAPKSNVIEDIGGGDTKTEIKEATDAASDAGSSEITFKTAECSPTPIMKDQPRFFADTCKTDQKTITIGEKSSNSAQQLAGTIKNDSISDNNKHVDEKDADKVQDTVDTTLDIPTSKNENIDTAVTNKDSLIKTDSNYNTEEHKNTQIDDQIAENNDIIEKSTDIIEQSDDELEDSFEDDINLRWDEEPTENRPSDDALKYLDQDLGIEDEIDEIYDETSPIGEGETDKVEESGDRIGETSNIDNKTEDNGDDIVPVSEGDIKEDTITKDLTEVGTNLINTAPTSKTFDTDTPVTIKRAKETIVDLPVGTPKSMDVDDVTAKSETVKLTEELVKAIGKIDQSVNEMSVDDIDVVKCNEDEGGENKMAVDAGDIHTDKQTDNKIYLDSEIGNKTNNQFLDESRIKDEILVKEEVELNELEFGDSKKMDAEKLDAIHKTLDEHNEKECARMKNDAGLKPDVMLEIPTQDLIDLDDDFNARSVESNLDEDDDYAKILAEKTLTEKERKNEESVCSNTSKESIKNVTQNEQPSKPEENIAKQTSDAVKKSKNEIHPSVTGLSSTSENDTPKLSIASRQSTEISEIRLLSTDLTEMSKKTEKSSSTEKIISTDQSLSAIQTTRTKPSTSTDQSLPTPQSTVDQLSSLHDQPPSPDDQLPSTSKDLTNITDVEEISDSLGLLAESSRVMDDDDEDEPDDDEDDDFDQDDESSNLLTADHSEDSNTPSEVEVPKDGAKETTEPENEKEGESSIVEKTLEMDNVERTETLHKTPEKEKDRMIEPSINTDKPNEVSCSVLVGLLSSNTTIESSKKLSPGKTSRLEISKPKAQHMLSFVELDESSSEDETTKSPVKDIVIEDSNSQTGLMESQNTTTPKKATKMTKLNTSEISIKTGNTCKPPLIIPEISNICETAKEPVNQGVKQKPDKKMLGLEIFSLDSDEEEAPPAPSTPIADKKPTKCVNNLCDSTGSQLYPADLTVSSYFGVTKRSMVCATCLEQVRQRTETLLLGIKNMTPLFDLAIAKTTSQLVEISDSESEDEEQVDSGSRETIGAKGAKLLEEHLASILNESWTKLNLEQRLRDTEQHVLSQLDSIQEKASELDDMLNACQKETDDIRKQIYVTFEPQRKYLDAIIIHDTNKKSFTCLEQEVRDDFNEAITAKRRLDSTSDVPAKRFANDLPSLAADTSESESVDKDDYDKDVSVVRLSQEAAPPDLPPAGDVVRPPLRAGDEVFAIRNAFGAWIRARIVEVHHKAHTQAYTNCRVRFDNAVKNIYRVISARCIAYLEPSPVRLSIGTRIIALFKDKEKIQEKGKRELFYSGVVAEIPNPVNSYRYLVFFDDGYAQYVHHKDTRVVCECSSLVWEEVHPFIRDFVCDYLLAYPERPMVRLHAEQRLKTEWNGKWWASKVLKVDASLALVHFERDNRTEWIYRGSTRLAPLYLELQAAERHRHRLPRSKAQNRSNMPYVEYTGHDETNKSQPTPQQPTNEELRRHAQRAVAKKSTTQPPAPPAPPAPHAPPPPPQQPLDGVLSRVVYYTPKNAVKPLKMVTHTCSPKCKRNDLLSLKELRTYNPLAKPLLSGWERQLVRYKGQRAVVYRAPCGRRLRSLPELHRYLQHTRHDMPVDLFDFNIKTHCLAEFVLNKVAVMKKDLSNGKENVPVPCVNYYDGSLPEFCSYNTERTPTAGVPLNLDPEFLCGCDCTDDCEDKSKCACWQLTLEGARTIGLDAPGVGYVYRRLPEPLPSGIYECNARCKCRSTCLNRVAQHPLQLKLQVFKTLNRGWGIRALNDVPRGAFLCVYAGNLLTDATANLDGLNEGDEYLAELDYIEVVEQMKEGYEEDIPEDIKKLDKKETSKSASESEEESPSEEEEANEDDKEDGDFQPGYIGVGPTEFNKRLRIRDKKTKEGEQSKEKEQDKDKETDNCITISDDEEVREPSRFTAQAGMGDKDFVSKYRSVRTLYGKDEACYIMDAKVQGNIGRYLNHSCSPNVFVQNVFVDTHDPRFPWVAFFALSHVKAGAELTWNYNYDIGSVPGKVLYCYCGTPNCRGRLL